MITINGFDAAEMGVTFLSGTAESLLTFPKRKPYIENNSRLIHGVQALATHGKVDKRKVSLSIRLEGDTHEDYLNKLEALQRLLISGNNGEGFIELKYLRYTFFLIYEDSDILRILAPNISNMVLNFTEPNPENRL